MEGLLGYRVVNFRSTEYIHVSREMILLLLLGHDSMVCVYILCVDKGMMGPILVNFPNKIYI